MNKSLDMAIEAIEAIRAEAVEAMRAKCEAIARNYGQHVNGPTGLVRVAIGKEIAEAIAALKGEEGK